MKIRLNADYFLSAAIAVIFTLLCDAVTVDHEEARTANTTLFTKSITSKKHSKTVMKRRQINNSS